MSRYFVDRLAKYAVFLWAAFSFFFLVAIVLFIFAEAVPFFREVSIWEFLFGSHWNPAPSDPEDASFGILPMIVGSLVVTVGAMVLAVPLGVACAILMAEVAPKIVRNFLKPAVELLVGIPSVVYGAIGLLVIVPWVRDSFGGSGLCIASAALVLMAMVLPTIISISEDKDPFLWVGLHGFLHQSIISTIDLLITAPQELSFWSSLIKNLIRRLNLHHHLDRLHHIRSRAFEIESKNLNNSAHLRIE